MLNLWYFERSINGAGVIVQNSVRCSTSLRERSKQHVVGAILTSCPIPHYKTIILPVCLRTDLFWSYSWKELLFESFGWICEFTYEGINFCRNGLLRVDIIYQSRGSLTLHLTYRQVKHNFVIFYTHTHTRAHTHSAMKLRYLYGLKQWLLCILLSEIIQGHFVCEMMILSFLSWFVILSAGYF